MNNAASTERGDAHTTDSALFARLLDNNTLAPFRLVQAALPQRRQTGDCVHNISSVNVYCGEPNSLPYNISKDALMTLSRNLENTLMRKDGVRVNQINPCWPQTETEQQLKIADGIDEQWHEYLPEVCAPSGRIQWPREVAATAID